MANRFYDSLCVLGVLTGSAGSVRADGAASKGATGSTAAPTRQRWVYSVKLGGKPAPFSLVLVETGRRRLAGRRGVDLAVKVGGHRVAMEERSWIKRRLRSPISG